MLGLACLGLTPIFSQQPPSLDLPSLDNSGALRFHLRGDSGAQYAAEISADLKSWWLYSAAVTTNGQFDFSYLPRPGASARYFRARVDVPLAPLNVTPQTDPNLLDAGLITPEQGGSVSLTDTNGITYTLTVPTNAVISSEVIELTVITNLPGLPFSGTNLAAVLLDPPDVHLWAPAQLRISFPTNRPIDWTQLTGYAFASDGSFLRLSPFSAETNTVVMPVFDLGGFGCGVATLAEIEALSHRPVGPASTVQTTLIRGGAQPQSVVPGGTFLERCFRTQLAEAKAADQTLKDALEELDNQLWAKAVSIMRSRPDLGSAVNRWTYSWDGNSDWIYSDLYNRLYAPYLARADQNCALTEVLAKRIQDLRHLAGIFGGSVAAAAHADLYICSAFNNCFQQMQDCCRTKGLDGMAGVNQAQGIAAEAAQFGCTVPPGAIDGVKKACLPTWSGSITILQGVFSTNHSVADTITTFDDYSDTCIITYDTDAQGLQGQSAAPGLYSLSGNLIAHGSCIYGETTVTVDTACCAACTTTTVSSSLTSRAAGTGNGTFLYQLTDGLPLVFPIPLQSIIIPDATLVQTTHQVKEPVHSTLVFSFEDTDKKGFPFCNAQTVHNNFVGKHDFPGVSYFGFASGVKGTSTSYSGVWETNIVHADGITVSSIRAVWEFNRN